MTELTRAAGKRNVIEFFTATKRYVIPWLSGSTLLRHRVTRSIETSTNSSDSLEPNTRRADYASQRFVSCCTCTDSLPVSRFLRLRKETWRQTVINAPERPVSILDRSEKLIVSGVKCGFTSLCEILQRSRSLSNHSELEILGGGKLGRLLCPRNSRLLRLGWTNAFRGRRGHRVGPRNCCPLVRDATRGQPMRCHGNMRLYRSKSVILSVPYASHRGPANTFPTLLDIPVDYTRSALRTPVSGGPCVGGFLIFTGRLRYANKCALCGSKRSRVRSCFRCNPKLSGLRDQRRINRPSENRLEIPCVREGGGKESRGCRGEGGPRERGTRKQRVGGRLRNGEGEMKGRVDEGSRRYPGTRIRMTMRRTRGVRRTRKRGCRVKRRMRKLWATRRRSERAGRKTR